MPKVDIKCDIPGRIITFYHPAKQELWLALFFSKEEWTDEAFAVSSPAATITTAKWGGTFCQHLQAAEQRYLQGWVSSIHIHNKWMGKVWECWCLLLVVYVLDLYVTCQRNNIPSQLDLKEHCLGKGTAMHSTVNVIVLISWSL